ncbi:hypothetical protein F2P56_025109, partial [Juglans regia]
SIWKPYTQNPENKVSKLAASFSLAVAALSFVLGSSVPQIHPWWPSKESKRRGNNSVLSLPRRSSSFPDSSRALIFPYFLPPGQVAQSKLEEMHMEEKDVQNNLQRKLRGQLLFFGITMGLLAEIINSRFFTNVWDSFGLTYDVSFELNLFDRLKLGWYVISVTSTPGKV